MHIMMSCAPRFSASRAPPFVLTRLPPTPALGLNIFHALPRPSLRPHAERKPARVFSAPRRESPRRPCEQESRLPSVHDNVSDDNRLSRWPADCLTPPRSWLQPGIAPRAWIARKTFLPRVPSASCRWGRLRAECHAPPARETKPTPP